MNFGFNIESSSAKTGTNEFLSSETSLKINKKTKPFISVSSFHIKTVIFTRSKSEK